MGSETNIEVMSGVHEPAAPLLGAHALARQQPAPTRYHLTQSVFQVVLQKSTAPLIRQLILYYH